MIRCSILCMVLAIPPVAWCQHGQLLLPATCWRYTQAVALALQNNVNVKNAILGVVTIRRQAHRGANEASASPSSLP